MNETKIFKMPVKNNNKIDRIIFGKLTLPVIDWGYKNNLTPNFFTTLSFSFQLSSIYFLKNYNPYIYIKYIIFKSNLFKKKIYINIINE